MRLTRDLVDFGFVSEGETLPTNGRGRPSDTLNIRADAAHFAGIKLTGDVLYAAVTDLHAKVLSTEEHPLDSRSIEAVVDLIASVVSALRVEYPRLTSIGVCLAGDIEHLEGRSIIVGSAFLGWARVPLQSLVEGRTGLPTSTSNDVQALTEAHHWFGAGIGCHTLALVGLGAGIGAGLVVDDHLVRGARGHPGKVGHLPVTADGPVCDRGHRGCVSAYVTVPALLKNAGTTGFWQTLELAMDGDERAIAAFEAAGRALGAVVAYLANLIDPEKIIITGEGLAIATFARKQLDEELAARLDPAAEPVTLELYEFNFADYAWAAAISAIRSVV